MNKRKRERNKLKCKKNTTLCWIDKTNKEPMNGLLVRNESRKLWAEWVMYTRKPTTLRENRTSAL